MLTMHPALQEVAHRPWPLPGRQWTWRQSWLDLAFLHFRVPADSLRGKIPRGLRLDEFEGSAWVGVVPFRMSGVMRRPLPDLPFFGSFPELNLRTYVEADGKQGVWFFSLDADSWPLVLGGRHLYDLPYHAARMQQEWREGWCSFSSERRSGGAQFRGRYRPEGEVALAARGTFEHWATERYCLYSSSPRGLTRVEVHHAPWPLQRARLEITQNGILAAAGIVTRDPNPICHFSAGVQVVTYAREFVKG